MLLLRRRRVLSHCPQFLLSPQASGSAKEEPEMLKLFGVGKILTGGGSLPSPPPKKEILDRKRKYQTEKGCLTKNIRKYKKRELEWMANLSYANHHWHLLESKSVFLVPRQSEWAKKKNQQKSFLSQCARSRSNVKEVTMLTGDAFWDKNRNKINEI